MTDTTAPEAKDATCEYVDKFASLQEQLYASEASNEWSAEAYQGVLNLLTDANAPKTIVLRSHELAAKYAPKFPTESKSAFALAMAALESDDSTVVHAVMKKIDGYLSLPGVVQEKGPEYLLALYEKQAMEDGEEKTAACKKVEGMLSKMAGSNPAALSKACIDVLLADSSTTESWRDFVLKYLVSNVLEAQKTALAANPEAETMIKDEISKLLHVVSKKEFSVLLEGLTGLKISQVGGSFGPQGVVDTLATLIDTEANMDFTVTWQVERMLSIITTALDYFSEGVVDKIFTKYLVCNCIAPEGVLSLASPAHAVAVLQRLCEVASYSTDETAAECVKLLYPILFKHLPEDEASTEINFTFCECLLVSVCVLGRKAPDAFKEVSGVKVGLDLKSAQEAAAAEIKSKEEIEADKALKTKLNNLQLSTSKIMVQLNTVRQQLQKSPQKTDETKSKLVELQRVIPNLTAILYVLKFVTNQYPHFPPAPLTPSWIKPSKKRAADAGAKNKQQKRGRGEDNAPTNQQKKPRTGGGGKGGKKGGKGGRKGGKKF